MSRFVATMRQVAGEQRSRNPGATRTAAHAVNDAKQVVGIYYETAGLPHGFLYFRGSFTPVDFPGAIDTFPRSINNRGVVVGMYDVTQMAEGAVTSPSTATRTSSTATASLA